MTQNLTSCDVMPVLVCLGFYTSAYGILHFYQRILIWNKYQTTNDVDIIINRATPLSIIYVDRQ